MLRELSNARVWFTLIALVAIGTGYATARDAKELSPSAAAFLQQVHEHWAQWDRDQSGELSVAELDAVVADPETRGPAAAAIAVLKRASRSQRYQMPPLTVTNLEQIARAKRTAERPDLSAMYAGSLKRIDEVRRDLFVSGQPRLETIHQGKLGNCFCLAPLGAVLHSDPKRVAGMFHRQPDGSWQITLGPRRVCIAPPTDAELAQTAGNEQDGIWVNLYEKAVGQARNLDLPTDKRHTSPIDALARGGSAGTMLSYITGHKIQRFSCKFANDSKLSDAQRAGILDELRGWLRTAMETQQPMTCGTKATTTPGLTPNHAYAVLGYASSSDSLKLWNPHGGSFQPKGEAGPKHGYPIRDGVFEIPLAAFVREFSGLAVETSQPAGDEPELPGLPQLTTSSTATSQ